MAKRQTSITNGNQTVTLPNTNSPDKSSTSSSSGLSTSNKIALGVGIGFGVPTLIATIYAAIWGPGKKWRRKRKVSKTTRTETGVKQPAIQEGENRGWDGKAELNGQSSNERGCAELRSYPSTSRPSGVAELASSGRYS